MFSFMGELYGTKTFKRPAWTHGSNLTGKLDMTMEIASNCTSDTGLSDSGQKHCGFIYIEAANVLTVSENINIPLKTKFRRTV
jgi:hypothetical protein